MLWSLLSVIVFAASVSANVDPVVIKGSHFFYKTNGSEFFIRGVTYQPPSNSTPGDPLAVSLTCMRDIQFLSQIATNVIRVSYLDSGSDHSACMTALQTAGIYVLVDLPGTASISSTNPEWNLDIYGSWTTIIDAMAGYNNVFGFFAGSMVVTNSGDSPSAAFMKAAVRDLKSYMANKNYRAIPVGYERSASDNYDVASVYMTCSNSSESIDFLGISNFNWCVNNTFLNSGYKSVIDLYGNYPVPVFFSQYGCKDVASVSREFGEIQYIYGAEMTNVVSGGIVYEYFQDNDNLGLVTVISPSSASALADFTSYSSQIARITPSSTPASNYTISNTITQSCPTAAFSASPTLPPVVNKDICNCMMINLECVTHDSVNATTATSVLETLCGPNSQNCPALHGNGATGKYGAYSMCNITARLSWALNVKYQGATGCANDPYAMYQPYNYSYQCYDVLVQAGPSGTGTITRLPTFISATATGSQFTGAYVHYYYDSKGLSDSEKAGIVSGTLIGVAILGCALWFFCIRKRRRGSGNKNGETKDIDQQDTAQSAHLYPPPGNRGGSVSMLSEDSQDMSELPPFDESYMGQSSTQWSRTELHTPSTNSEIPAGYNSVSERDAAIEEMHTPLSGNSDLESPTTSRMGSDKELPAFRRGMEDKSLSSMKLLSPMIKVSPVERSIRRKPV